jgi:hypothetical protein
MYSFAVRRRQWPAIPIPELIGDSFWFHAVGRWLWASSLSCYLSSDRYGFVLSEAVLSLRGLASIVWLEGQLVGVNP